MAVTGPKTKAEQSPAQVTPGFGAGWRYAGAYYWSRTWYTQPRPHVAPLPFSYFKREVTRSPQKTVSSLGTKYDTTAEALAKNKAYAKLINGDFSRGLPGLGAKAELGVTLGERAQAIEMIAKRATQLRNAVKALKRGDAKSFGRELGITKSKRFKKMTNGNKFRDTSKDVSSTFLEWHFGWVPLVKDIGDSVDVLQSEIPTTQLKSTATVQTSGGSQKVQWGERLVESWTTSVTVRMQTEVYVSNPNLRLASQLGFVNPAALIWEMVPFSFIIDWFVNVGQFLNSFTDFAGLTLVRPQTLVFGKTSESLDVFNSTTGARISQGSGDTVRCVRTTGITGPSIRLNTTIDRLSPTRAAVAISLLGQGLKVIPHDRKSNASVQSQFFDWNSVHHS